MGWKRKDLLGMQDLPSLVVLPIDYSLDVALSDQLGAETVAT